MADQVGGNNLVVRDYRKGNWTLNETMILIEAKRMDDERRMKRINDNEGRGRPAELRWKWVEDYCWRKGCLRSQNQCNDKWDNLMRDYKKVRDYERRLAEKGGEGSSSTTTTREGSYWKLERNERKERNLPSNMLVQIYDALVEVVERRGGSGGGGGVELAHQRVVVGGGLGNPTSYNVAPILAPVSQHQVSASGVPQVLPPPAPQLVPPATQGHLPSVALPCPQPLPPVDSSETSEYSDSPAKRRRRREGTSGGGTASGSTSHGVGNAISKSASIIAEAIQACEEREERRHQDLMILHEKRLRIEESKTEINRQGINGLVEAINNLATSILALASNKNQSATK